MNTQTTTLAQLVANLPIVILARALVEAFGDRQPRFAPARTARA